jgi:hypothetical protein
MVWMRQLAGRNNAATINVTAATATLDVRPMSCASPKTVPVTAPQQNREQSVGQRGADDAARSYSRYRRTATPIATGKAASAGSSFLRYQ